MGYVLVVSHHRRDTADNRIPPHEIQPLDVDGVRTMIVGTVLWLLAFILLLPFYGRLQESGSLWWLWTCLAGFGLGMYGIDYCRRRRSRRGSQGQRGHRRA